MTKKLNNHNVVRQKGTLYFDILIYPVISNYISDKLDRSTIVFQVI